MHDLKKDLSGALATMGYAELRSGQLRTLEELMYGNRDVISIAPTGGGKSAMAILPALAKGWRVLVISPLIALQNDQVEKLLARGVTAAAINSGKREDYVRMVSDGWARGLLQFLYVAPERLETAGFRDLMNARRPHLLVVDEVHTASLWGDDFRPAYHKISGTIDQLRPARVLCLTATLTESNETDVRRILHLEQAVKLTFYERRDNLEFFTMQGNDADAIEQQLKRSTGPTIVYSSTVRRIEEELFPLINGRFGKAGGGGVVRYHGKLEHDERELAQNLFMGGSARIIVATNAFGLGVDKADIRMIVHADLPGSIEAYIQEAGRAGRDGQPSVCAIGYDYKSVSTQLFFSKCRNPHKADLEKAWRYLNRLVGQENGVIQKTVESLAIGCGLMEPMMASIINILKAEGLIEREYARPTYEIQLDRKMSEQSAPPEFQATLANLLRLADMERLVSMPPAALAKALELKPRELEPQLKRLAGRDLLVYTPPTRAKRTRLKPGADLGQLDWPRLAKKARREMKQLAQMIAFVEIKDDRKHEAAEAYFQEGKLPKALIPKNLPFDLPLMDNDSEPDEADEEEAVKDD